MSVDENARMTRDDAVRLRRAAAPGAFGRVSFPPSVWGHVLSWAVVAVLVLLASLAVDATGGAPNPFMHLYYVPILYSAARHGVSGAAVTALAAGIIAGPLTPTDSGPQAVSDWTVRLVIFVVVGVIAAWLAREQPRPIDVMVRDVCMGQALRAAVRQGHINVHFQPLVLLSDGTVMGTEALCRWSSGGRSRMPDDFIPAAERSGSIHVLGREVMRQAMAQARAWAAGGRPELLLNVNVSAVELNDERFLDHLAGIVAAHANDNFRLCIEITESALVVDPERARAVLEAARDMGVTIALDDFGTGYSSLTYLADFPIDIIKIDRAFVAAVDVDPTSRSLITAMVQLAASLGAVTIAEGIERPEQLRTVIALGCTMGQGFHLGRPGHADLVDWERRAVA